MRKILVPFDGSEPALRAARYAASTVKEYGALQLELLYVLDPMEFRAHTALSQSNIEHLQTDEADRILHPARVLLDQAGVFYQAHVRTGAPAQCIVDHARDAGCDAIIMGTRGMGPIASLLVGSVAARTIHLADVPVTLIK